MGWQKCRRSASETHDTVVALFLFRLADEVEAEALEADNYDGRAVYRTFRDYTAPRNGRA